MPREGSAEAIDRIVLGMLTVYGPRWDESVDRLAGFGPASLHRLFDLWTKPDRPAEVSAAFSKLGRETIDEINAIFGALAARFPSVYLDRMRRPPGTSEVIIAARLADPRVVPVLREALTREDWLVRYWAARGLLARDEPTAADALADALADKDYAVRRLAIIGLARTDRPAAVARCEAAIADPTLPEHHRDEARRDRHALRSGHLPRAER